MRSLTLAVSTLPFLVACASAAPCPATGASPQPSGAPAAQPASDTSAAPPSGSAAIVYDLPRAGDFPSPPPEDLPGAVTHQAVSSVLMVDIDQNGVWSANGKPLGDHADLIRIARESLAGDPDVRAIIRADRGVAWGSVISAIDQLKQGGIAKLAFAVSPLPSP